MPPAPTPRPTLTRRGFLVGALGVTPLATWGLAESTERPAPPSAFRLSAVPLSPVSPDDRPALVHRFPALDYGPRNTAPIQLFNLLGTAPGRPIADAGPVGDCDFIHPQNPACRVIPWVPLFARPVPTRAAPPALVRTLGLSTLGIRDEGGPNGTNIALYGNKARKYEYALANAIFGGATHLTTVASLGSNHAVALAVAARFARLGRAEPLPLTVRAYPQRVTPAVAAKQRYLRALGAEVTLLSGDVRAGAALARQRVAERLGLDDPTVFSVPPGGSNVHAVWGHVDAALELATALADQNEAPPDDVFVALGSGATAAGLALGFALLGWNTRIVATLSQNKPRWMGALVFGDPDTPLAVSAARALFRDAADLLGCMVDRPTGWAEDALGSDRFVIDAETWKPAYGEDSEVVQADRDLAAAHGLLLDETFAGKSFSTLCQWARDGRLNGRRPLFWNTFHRFDPAAWSPALAAAPLPDLA